MANPIDSDASTERFDGYEAELKLVEADLSQKLDQILEQSGEHRKSTINQAQRLAEEAQELASLLSLLSRANTD